MLFEDAARNQDDGSLSIQRLNLAGKRCLRKNLGRLQKDEQKDFERCSVFALAQRILPTEQEPNLPLVLRGVRTHADDDAGMIAGRRTVRCR